MARNPFTAVPATRSSLPLLQIRRWVVLGALGAVIATSAASTVAWVSSDHGPAAPPPLSDPTAVSLAQTAVQDFLASRTSAVPAVKDVNADFAAVAVQNGQTPKALDVQELTFAGSQSCIPGTVRYQCALGDGTQLKMTTEQETFNALIGGKLYTVTVPMVKSGTAWLLGASPSLAPANLGTNQSAPGIDYAQMYNGAGNESLFPSASYRNQIKNWAATFAAAGHADPRLLALTGDGSNHTYSGLGGWSLVSDPQIRSVVPVSKPSPGFIVRVGLVLRSPAPNGPTLSTDYDLYMRSDVSDQLPPVVAWGAAGSYLSLQPYFNADQR